MLGTSVGSLVHCRLVSSLHSKPSSPNSQGLGPLIKVDMIHMYLRRERRRAERVPRPLRKDANTSSKINEITQRRQRGTDCPINEACDTATQRDSNISILLGIKDFHSILLRRWRNFPLTSSWPRPFTPLLPPTPHPHFPKTAPTHP